MRNKTVSVKDTMRTDGVLLLVAGSDLRAVFYQVNGRRHVVLQDAVRW